MAEAQVSNAVVTTVEFGIGLPDDILQDRHRLPLRTEHPGIRAQIVALPLGCNLLIGDNALHHTFVTDTGQRGIEVDHIA